jgi:hypothetical protein
VSKNVLEIIVDYDCGTDSNETPRWFYIKHKKIEVTDIIDRWISAYYRYLKVRGNDGGIYVLRYKVEQNSWDLLMYDSDTLDKTRLSSTSV